MSKRADHWAPLFEGLITSAKFWDLPSHSARLFYALLQLKLDHWGRATADPRKLRALVWPLAKETDKTTLAAIEACRQVGLIAIYQSDDGPFLFNVEHEDKAGTIGKYDHRRVSKFPDTDGLAPLGPEWPSLARNGPGWPSRAPGRGSVRIGSGSDSSSPESDARAASVEPWGEAFAKWPHLDVPDVHAAIAEWVAYKREKRHTPWKAREWSRNLRPFGADLLAGPSRFVAAVDSSITKTYIALVEPKVGESRNGHAPTGVEAGDLFLERMRSNGKPTVTVEARPA